MDMGSQGTKTAEKLSLALKPPQLLWKLTHYAVYFVHLRHIAESTFKTLVINKIITPLTQQVGSVS